MATLRHYLRLSLSDRLNAWELALLLVAAEISLRLRHFKRLRALTRSRPALQSKSLLTMPGADGFDFLAWLVTAIDRRGPWRPSCLRQSLALAWWFRRRHLPASLEIGVAKVDGQLKAHAWLQAEAEKPFYLLNDVAIIPLVTSMPPSAAKPRASSPGIIKMIAATQMIDSSFPRQASQLQMG